MLYTTDADFNKRFEAATTTSKRTLQQLADEFKALREIVHNILNLLHQQARDCAKMVDALDMRQRQKALLINGITEDKNTDIQQEVLNLIHEKLGLLHVSKDCIKRYHRMGVQRGEHIRPVLVHFRYHNTKAELWRSKSKLKGTGYTVTEFLSKVRLAIHKRYRRHFNMKNVWTLDGLIYIKVPGGDHVKIVTEEELDRLISEYPDTIIPREPLATSCGAQQQVDRHQAPRSKPNIAEGQGEHFQNSCHMGLKK